MKIQFCKHYWKDDVYDVPRHHDRPYKKDEVITPELVHRKGDYKETLSVVEEWCCTPLEEYASICHEYDDRSGKSEFGCFFQIPGWDEPNFVLINYCPFCGEKIDIIKEEK